MYCIMYYYTTFWGITRNKILGYTLSESLFYDYVVNPYSTQGNTINSTPDNLVFRADLGTQLITSSRTSIHPKITGSWATTQSFSKWIVNFIVHVHFIQNRRNIS